MNEVVVEGLLLIAAGRAYATARAPVLARPRRGNVDLPDLDAPDRAPAAADPPSAPATPELDRWILPASVGIVAVVGGGIVARAATLLI